MFVIPGNPNSSLLVAPFWGPSDKVTKQLLGVPVTLRWGSLITLKDFSYVFS